MPWALEKRSRLPEFEWERAYLYSSSNSRQLRLETLIWPREYANIDANEIEDIVHVITTLSV
jgi:hypothetical protein